MKVVIDANVFVSFLLTRGPTISQILKLWQEKKFTLLATDEIILEVQQVLERFVAVKLVKKQEAAALLRRIKKDSFVITSLSQTNILVDKKDNRYLACAQDGQADFLVSGDKHLLRLKNFANTKIVTPIEFIESSKRQDINKLTTPTVCPKPINLHPQK